MDVTLRTVVPFGRSGDETAAVMRCEPGTQPVLPLGRRGLCRASKASGSIHNSQASHLRVRIMEQPHGPPPVIQLIRTDRRAAGTVFALVAVHLLMSVRFFAKYVDELHWVTYGLFVCVGSATCAATLKSSRLLTLLTRPWMLVLALASLFTLVLVAYPRADALRAVGRGSDQDDCVVTLVSNVFAGRAPFGFGYFGDPCSTGPSEFFLYFPVQVSRSYFVIVPVLSVLLGYWVLSQVTDRHLAVLLSLTQFTSWLFLEMSAVGSDMVLIAWVFAAATVAAPEGLQGHSTVLTAIGGLGYFLFAGSRVPLILVAAASLWVLVMVFGARAIVVVTSVAVATVALYLSTYAADPSSFTPGHLVGKSANIGRYLAGGSTTPLVVGVVALVVIMLIASLRGGSRAFVRRQYFLVNFLLITLPMGAVAIWDLSRRDFDPALWEGLHYLFLSIPALLVAVGDRLQVRTRACSPS